MVREGPSEEATLAESWRVGGGEGGRGRGVSMRIGPEGRRRTVRVELPGCTEWGAMWHARCSGRQFTWYIFGRGLKKSSNRIRFLF